MPAPTRWSMAASDVLMNYWHYWAPALVAAIAGIVWYKRTPQGRKVWDGMMLDLPVVGTVVRKVAISRSSGGGVSG